MPCANGRDAQAVPRRCATSSVTRWCRIRCIPRPRTRRVLSLIYDHHVRDLSRKLTERQHDAHGLIVTTLHVHLDHHNCLEILVLKGKAGELRELADQLRSIRGVTHGTFSITTIGADLP